MNRNGIDRKRRNGAYREERLDASDGDREQLLGALRECYGLSNSEAEFRFRQCVYGTEAVFDTEADSPTRLRLAH
jgi:hypothetical protein